jgi:hypothetical protein
MGSTRIARRAGTMQAARATAIRMLAVPADVTGSDVGTPYRNPARDRATAKPPILEMLRKLLDDLVLTGRRQAQ